MKNRIEIIIKGPPGSGKSQLASMIRYMFDTCNLITDDPKFSFSKVQILEENPKLKAANWAKVVIRTTNKV